MGESLFRLYVVVGGNGNKTPFILGNLNDKNCNTYYTFACTDSFDSDGNCLPVSFRRLRPVGCTYINNDTGFWSRRTWISSCWGVVAINSKIQIWFCNNGIDYWDFCYPHYFSFCYTECWQIFWSSFYFALDVMYSCFNTKNKVTKPQYRKQKQLATSLLDLSSHFHAPTSINNCKTFDTI